MMEPDPIALWGHLAIEEQIALLDAAISTQGAAIQAARQEVERRVETYRRLQERRCALLQRSGA